MASLAVTLVVVAFAVVASELLRRPPTAAELGDFTFPHGPTPTRDEILDTLEKLPVQGANIIWHTETHADRRDREANEIDSTNPYRNPQ